MIAKMRATPPARAGSFGDATRSISSPRRALPHTSDRSRRFVAADRASPRRTHGLRQTCSAPALCGCSKLSPVVNAGRTGTPVPCTTPRPGRCSDAVVAATWALAVERLHLELRVGRLVEAAVARDGGLQHARHREVDGEHEDEQTDEREELRLVALHEREELRARNRVHLGLHELPIGLVVRPAVDDLRARGHQVDGRRERADEHERETRGVRAQHAARLVARAACAKDGHEDDAGARADDRGVRVDARHRHRQLQPSPEHDDRDAEEERRQRDPHDRRARDRVPANGTARAEHREREGDRVRDAEGGRHVRLLVKLLPPFDDRVGRQLRRRLDAIPVGADEVVRLVAHAEDGDGDEDEQHPRRQTAAEVERREHAARARRAATREAEAEERDEDHDGCRAHDRLDAVARRVEAIVGGRLLL
mmetsp:Transcript_56312/g.154742  ORF Transcript_56312/g.154742 Transcript_56312/m.154742 type:complete len:423 (+) Transcript_56312:134-1402(+)